MNFDDAVARRLKTDKCVSVLWFLDKLKAFFVEVSYILFIYTGNVKKMSRTSPV